MAIAPIQTADTTYTLQIADGDGGWSWYSQVEYETEAEVRELASEMYGGLAADEYRVIRIERHVI
ncbi:hypothetical protein K1W54_04360 [Micromonospora sp. CPCC 205371]|nr:hypothetical protein [Micromonospora sp. CPCC 205371]